MTILETTKRLSEDTDAVDGRGGCGTAHSQLSLIPPVKLGGDASGMAMLGEHTQESLAMGR